MDFPEPLSSFLSLKLTLGSALNSPTRLSVDAGVTPSFSFSGVANFTFAAVGVHARGESLDRSLEVVSLELRRVFCLVKEAAFCLARLCVVVFLQALHPTRHRRARRTPPATPPTIAPSGSVSCALSPMFEARIWGEADTVGIVVTVVVGEARVGGIVVNRDEGRTENKAIISFYPGSFFISPHRVFSSGLR